MKKNLGFTIIELMITLTILSILAAAALPAYRGYMLTQRVRSASYDLTSTLVFARSEAIKRNTIVSITQASGGWANGWTVAAGTTVLRTQDAYKSGVTITNSAALSTISYANDGRLANTTTDFTINSPDGSSLVATRCVSIRIGGMPSARLGSC